MKNLMRLIGIIALTAIIGLGFTACGGDDYDPPALQGTWKLDKGGGQFFSLKFTGSKYELVNEIEKQTKGTYTYTATTFTLTLTHLWVAGAWEPEGFGIEPLTVSYVISGNTLIVSGLTEPDVPYNGDWIKQ